MGEKTYRKYIDLSVFGWRKTKIQRRCKSAALKRANPARGEYDMTTVTLSAAEIKSMDSAGNAVQSGIKSAATVIDFEKSAETVQTAISAIRAGETLIGNARLEQAPHVQTVYNEMSAVGSIYYRKTTTQTVKDAITESFPVFAKSANTTEAIGAVFASTGMAESTARNLRDLASKPALLDLCKQGLPVTAAYLLARDKDLGERDYTAALQTRITPTNARAWLEAWSACKSAATAATAWSAATASKDTDAAEMAWGTVQGALTVIDTVNMADLLTAYDESAARVIRKEGNRRAAAAAAAAAKARDNESATAARLESAKKDMESATTESDQVSAARAEAVKRAKDLAARVDALKADIESAGKRATAAMLAELKALTHEAYAANLESESAIKLERESANVARQKRAEIEKLESSLLDAQLKRESAETNERQANTRPARPTGTTYESILDQYKALPIKRLEYELAELAAEVAGKKLLPEACALLRGLTTGIFETNA